jgi:hypothetical protein
LSWPIAEVSTPDQLRAGPAFSLAEYVIPAKLVLRPTPSVIARSEATKQSQGGWEASGATGDCRAFSSRGLENGSQ